MEAPTRRAKRKDNLYPRLAQVEFCAPPPPPQPIKNVPARAAPGPFPADQKNKCVTNVPFNCRKYGVTDTSSSTRLTTTTPRQ